VNKKFDQRVKRIADKISMSITPVPGFILGLSGTDSIAAFIILYEAMKIHGIENKLHGIHYVWEQRKKPTWFEESIIPWLKERCPEALLSVCAPYGGCNIEEARFADLKIRCSQGIPDVPASEHNWIVHSYADDRSYWMAACINLTEKKLGKYTILAHAATIWPVATLWKTDILEICKDQGVPQIALDMSRLPDCLCGRDELAADNIELIDQILQNNLDWNMVWDSDRNVIEQVYQWIRDIKKEYGFKERTPYMI
jgi:hypothetical protein